MKRGIPLHRYTRLKGQTKLRRVSKKQRKVLEVRSDLKEQHKAQLPDVFPCPFSGHPLRKEEAKLCHDLPSSRGAEMDTMENTFLGCERGNNEQGSRTLAVYMTLPIEVRRRNCLGEM